MSVTASPAQTAPRPSPQNSRFDVEASCPLPILILIASSAAWLLAGSILALIASLKFHNPHFLADEPYLTYGRVHAAHLTAVLYGFGVQAALAVGLWILSRLGRVPIAGPAMIFIGSILWNTAVTIGIVAILAGDGTGFEAFEMPRYVAAILFTGYVMIGICGLLTAHRRTNELFYPSQWFVLGSLFWFAWIFSTAAALLLGWPVRGVVQSCIAWWFAHNLSFICLGFAGLASIFYFIPKLTGRPLYSSHLASFTLWGLAVFGSWVAVPGGSPLPAWVASMGVVGAVLTIVPVLAVAVNIYQTSRGNLESLDSDVTLRFTYVALIFWLIACVQRIVGALPDVGALVDFTWYGVAQWEIFHYGFFSFAMFGAIYYMTPRLIDRANPPLWSPGLVKWHFRLTFAGVLISYLALLVGGIGQGVLLNDPKYGFVEVMRGTLMTLRVSTLGDLFLVIGTIVFLLNFALLVLRHGCRCWAAKTASMRKEPA